MPQNWRYKVYLLLFAILVSLYILVPSVLGFKGLREAAEKGAPLPWYVKFFPDRELNLGLDLQGGIYLELEVSVDEAVDNRLDVTAGEISRYLKDQKVEGASIDRMPKTRNIRALLPDEKGVEVLKKHVNDYYRGALEEKQGAAELVWKSDETDEAKLQTLFQELLQALRNREEVADVERSAGSPLFRAVLKDKAKPEGVASEMASRFPSLKPAEEPHKLILKAVDAYVEKLRTDSVKQAVETIRNRIDRYGVSEPSIRQLGSHRVAVELPGVTDPERAISIVKKAGKLEFKLVDESKSDEEVKALVTELRKAANLPEGYTEDIMIRLNEAAKGKIPADDEIAFELQYHPVSKKIVGGIPYLLKRKAEVTGGMLRNAQVSVQNNEPYVSLSFNTAGTQAFGDLTAANIGKRLAILLDGNVSKAPQIKSAIPSGEAQITLGYANYDALLKEADDLVLILREGALPATLKEATKTVIGPSLGKSSIDKGFKAMLLSAVLVMLFMAFRYKGSGLLTDIALCLNVLFIFGILALFGATLTLPGIAGIVLTIGMAVDANIIIFERIKEELGMGKPLKQAVEAGYHNAVRAVLDSNITVFLAGVVLYQFGTGPVRGFAVTLMIGIVTTLFTGVVVTRLVYDYFLIRRRMEQVSI